jgi:voltage-gated potassium channel
VRRERFRLLRQIDTALEGPMVFLGLIWLALAVVEIVEESLPRGLQLVSLAIWGAFILEFALRLTIAPDRVAYARRHWLTAVSLLLPALRILRFARVLRIARLARASRGARVARFLSGMNRGLSSLRKTFRRRRVAFVLAATVAVIFAGAAGIQALERDAHPGFDSYGDALWFTAMIVTTLGSESWPKTGEGRILAFFLSLWAIAIFGYVTATLASFFVGQDQKKDR